MRERRRFPRNPLPQKAKFFGAKGWEDCLITETSRKGLGVTFYTREKINEGSLILLKVPLPLESRTVEVKGMLKWIEQREEHFVGGIEWFRMETVKD